MTRAARPKNSPLDFTLQGLLREAEALEREGLAEDVDENSVRAVGKEMQEVLNGQEQA